MMSTNDLRSNMCIQLYKLWRFLDSTRIKSFQKKFERWIIIWKDGELEIYHQNIRLSKTTADTTELSSFIKEINDLPVDNISRFITQTKHMCYNDK